MTSKYNHINIIIVVSEFNSQVVSELLDGLFEACSLYDKINNDNILIYKVPGAFEIPGAVSCIIKNKKPDIIITLGSIIRGETSHYDHIAENCARGISDLSISYNIPIIFGVLCTENLEQALLRAETKGKDMLDAAIKTYDEYQKIKKNN